MRAGNSQDHVAPGPLGPTQGVVRAARVQPPREPPLTPDGSATRTSGTLAAPVVGTTQASRAISPNGQIPQPTNETSRPLSQSSGRHQQLPPSGRHSPEVGVMGLMPTRHKTHLVRNAFHLAAKRGWDALKRDVKPACTAVNAAAGQATPDDLAEKWGQQYASGSGRTLGTSSSRCWTTTSARKILNNGPSGGSACLYPIERLRWAKLALW